MALTSSQFSFCDKIGLLAENISKQDALNLIKTSFANNPDVDPAFKAKVDALTVDDFSYLVAPIYHYDVDLNYVLNRKTYTKHISDLGYYHCHKALEITNYYEKGEFTLIKDLDALKLRPYHKDCIFTMEEMKKALTDTIDKKLPSGYSSFESNDWKVNVYLVPCMAIYVKLNDKEYNIVANLHNKKIYTADYPKWEAPLKKAKKARTLGILMTVIAAILPLFGSIVSIGRSRWIGLIFGLAGVLLAIISVVKIKKTEASKLADKYRKDPLPKLASGMKLFFIIAGITLVLGLVSMILAAN